MGRMLGEAGVMGDTEYRIETERLTMREIREKDADCLVRWRSDPDAYRFFLLAHPITKEEHLRWFHEIYENDAGRIDWLCCEKDREKPVGVFGIRRDRLEPYTVEVSYLLDRSARHKGYAQEALRALLRWCRQHWRTERAVAKIHRENEASLHMIRKLGFMQKEEKDGFVLYRLDEWEGSLEK